jgi:broad specificity phosphatase PhoE
MIDSLIVIRSGSTDYEMQGRIRGAVDIPLCRTGVAEAGHAADLLAARPPRVLYTGGSACAIETGRIIATSLSLKPRTVRGLHNLGQGLWEGMLVDEIRRRQPRLYRQWQDNPWAVAPPEGELLEDACERVEAVLERLLRREEGRIALVVPEPLDSIVRWIVAGESMGDLWAREPDRAAVAELPVAAQWSRSRREARRLAGRT